MFYRIDYFISVIIYDSQYGTKLYDDFEHDMKPAALKSYKVSNDDQMTG